MASGISSFNCGLNSCLVVSETHIMSSTAVFRASFWSPALDLISYPTKVLFNKWSVISIHNPSISNVPMFCFMKLGVNKLEYVMV